MSRGIPHSMTKTRLFLLPLLLLILGLPAARAEGPVVRAVLFWAETCPHCHVILNETLPPLQEKYGDRLEVLTVEVSDPVGYELWRAAMDAWPVPNEQRGVPMLFIGSQVLVGSYDIPNRLPGLVEQGLAAGGVDYPAIPGLEARVQPGATPSPSPRPAPTRRGCSACDQAAGISTPTATMELAVHLWLFWSSHCPDCVALMEDTLPSILDGHEPGQVAVHQWDLEKGGYELMRSLEHQHGLQYGAMPEIFIGDEVLLGKDEIEARLPGLIDHYLARGGVALPGVLPTPTPEADAVVQLWLFYDSHCAPCMALKEEILTPILARYDEGQVEIYERDLEKGFYQELLALEARYGLGQGDIPEIFIGEHALLGNAQIQAELPGLIDHYLSQGGVTLPQVNLLTPTPEPAPDASAADAAIHLAYFYQTGCRDCDRVSLDLNYLQGRYPQLVVHEFDVKAEAALCEWLGQRAGVPEARRLIAPAVFVGDGALVDQELTSQALEALIARHAGTGAEAGWQGWEAGQGEAAGTILERFRSFGVLTVLAAGLVDGLNPCAFATIVFFISYLAFVGRGRREVLAVGAAFALGVFLTYLGVGFGLLKFLASLPFLAAISRWVYGLTAMLCLVLAAGSLHDWWQARRGQPEDMRLKLPLRLRRWINRVIREGAGLRAFVPVALVTGMAISIIELACTGQVYLPTIIFVLGVPELKARAAFYLVLYNLVFVLPLVVVFVLAYLGTTSEQLGQFINRRAATVKLLTAGLFLVLAGWLVVALV